MKIIGILFVIFVAVFRRMRDFFNIDTYWLPSWKKN